MLGQSLGHRENAATHPKPDPRSRRGLGQRGQPPVDFGKSVDRDQAFAARHSVESKIEVDIESVGGTAKMDQLATHRERSHELCSLKRFRRVGQHGEPPIHAVLQIVRRPSGNPLRETT